MADNKVEVQSTKDETKWKHWEKLPQGKKIETALCATYSAPVRGMGKAQIQCNLITRQKLATIKHSHTVFTHLQQDRVYLKYNAFKTKTTASTGFLIDLHATLVQKDDLQRTPTQELKMLPISKNIKEINQWIA
eukprot:11960342-Ditylum_brightwellii.AAC.1